MMRATSKKSFLVFLSVTSLFAIPSGFGSDKIRNNNWLIPEEGSLESNEHYMTTIPHMAP